MPLVDSVALALLPKTEGAISRSTCCFEESRKVGWDDLSLFYDAFKEGAFELVS